MQTNCTVLLPSEVRFWISFDSVPYPPTTPLFCTPLNTLPYLPLPYPTIPPPPLPYPPYPTLPPFPYTTLPTLPMSDFISLLALYMSSHVYNPIKLCLFSHQHRNIELPGAGSDARTSPKMVSGVTIPR